MGSRFHRSGRTIPLMLIVALASPLLRAVPAGPLGDNTEIEFASFAEEFADLHEVAGQPRNEALVLDILQRNFVVARLGAFDLYQARDSFSGSGGPDQFETAAATLLKVQERFLEWLVEDPATIPTDGFKEMQKWVRSWKLKKLAKQEGAAGTRPDLLDLLEAKDDVRAAALAVEDFLRDQIGGPETPISVVVTASRLEFLQWGSFVGSFDDVHRSILWNPGLASWVHFHEPGFHVLATEYPQALPGAGDFTRGQSMATFEKTGLEQHLAQQGAELLLHRKYGNALPSQIRAGLGVNMAVELFGENNVRSGNGSVGQSIPGVNKFVRKGHSAGGQSRARRQQNRFRRDAGKDYFLSELRKAQKDGAVLAGKDVAGEDRNLYFALQGEAGSEDHLLRAPFLSPAGYADEIPEEYEDDCQEFLRAYRSAFACWLRHHAEGSEPDSEARFGELLRAVDPAAEDPVAAFDALLSGLYGGTLGGTDAGVERPFLDWLARRR